MSPINTLETDRPRVVIDTNVLVSGILFRGKTITRALGILISQFSPVFSEATWEEFFTVLLRPEFESRLKLAQRLLVLSDWANRIEIVESHSEVTASRDPDDNKFLALALDAGAKIVVSGDKDLTDLGRYADIGIYTPSTFLEHYTD